MPGVQWAPRLLRREAARMGEERQEQWVMQEGETRLSVRAPLSTSNEQFAKTTVAELVQMITDGGRASTKGRAEPNQ